MSRENVEIVRGAFAVVTIPVAPVHSAPGARTRRPRHPRPCPKAAVGAGE
jgi:hypothetical protein